MNDKAMRLISGADALLENVLVSGSSTFLMADARRSLKAAYDLLKQEETTDDPTGGVDLSQTEQ